MVTRADFAVLAPESLVKASGMWSSDAYLRYLRETDNNVCKYTEMVCNAIVHDVAADEFAIDGTGLDDEDFD